MHVRGYIPQTLQQLLRRNSRAALLTSVPEHGMHVLIAFLTKQRRHNGSPWEVRGALQLDGNEA